MLGYIITALVSACIGFGAAALLVASKDDNRKIEDKKYICNINAGPCQDTCCSGCQGIEECDYACKGDPENCGNSRTL